MAKNHCIGIAGKFKGRAFSAVRLSDPHGQVVGNLPYYFIKIDRAICFKAGVPWPSPGTELVGPLRPGLPYELHKRVLGCRRRQEANGFWRSR